MANDIPTLTLTPDVPELTTDPAGTALAETPGQKPVETAMDALSPEERKAAEEFARQIDVRDANMVLQYGAAAQKKVSSFSESALEKVRTKDLGAVGDVMANLMVQLRGFSAEADERGFLGLFKKGGRKISALKARYDKASVNVDGIANMLEDHQVTLLKDITVLDKMYDSNLAYFKELTMYIVAGKTRLEEVRSTDLAASRKRRRRPAFRRTPRPRTTSRTCATASKKRCTIWS